MGEDGSSASALHSSAGRRCEFVLSERRKDDRWLGKKTDGLSRAVVAQSRSRAITAGRKGTRDYRVASSVSNRQAPAIVVWTKALSPRCTPNSGRAFFVPTAQVVVGLAVDTGRPVGLRTPAEYQPPPTNQPLSLVATFTKGHDAECVPCSRATPSNGPHPSKMNVTSMVTRYSSIFPSFTLAFSSIT